MQEVSATLRVARPVSIPTYELKYYLDGRVQTFSKIRSEDFTPAHWRTLETAAFNAAGHLVFDNPHWQSVWLGAGEEKAVYLVVDAENHAFALELLDRATYLEGKLMEGHYFGDVCMSKIRGYKPNPGSLVGHVFGSRGRVREFIHGETLAGKLTQPRHKNAHPLAFPLVWLTRLSHELARSIIYPRYKALRQQYGDAHEANVVIELIPLHNPEHKNHYFLPLLWSDHDGYPHWRFFRLTPIDVRTKGRRCS